MTSYDAAVITSCCNTSGISSMSKIFYMLCHTWNQGPITRGPLLGWIFFNYCMTCVSQNPTAWRPSGMSGMLVCVPGRDSKITIRYVSPS